MNAQTHFNIARWAFIISRIIHMTFHFLFLIFNTADLFHGEKIAFFTCSCFILIFITLSCVKVIRKFQEPFKGALFELIILGVSFLIYSIVSVDLAIDNPSKPNSTYHISSSLLEVNSNSLHSKDHAFFDSTVSNYITNETFNLGEDANDQLGSKTAHGYFKSDPEKAYLYYVLPSFISVILQGLVFAISCYHRWAVISLEGFQALENQGNPQDGANEQMNLGHAVHPLNIGNAVHPPNIGNAVHPPNIGNAVHPQNIDNAVNHLNIDNAVNQLNQGDGDDDNQLNYGDGDDDNQLNQGDGDDNQLNQGDGDDDQLNQEGDNNNQLNQRDGADNQQNQAHGDDNNQLNQAHGSDNQLNQAHGADNRLNQAHGDDNNQLNQGDGADNKLNQGDGADNQLNQGDGADNNQLNQSVGANNRQNQSEDDESNQVGGIN